MDDKNNHDDWDMWAHIQREYFGSRRNAQSSGKSGCLTIITVFTVIAIIIWAISKIEAVLILFLLIGVILLTMFMTHMIWNATFKKCNRLPNKHFRGAVKAAVGYLTFMTFFAISDAVSDTLKWKYTWENMGWVIVITGSAISNFIIYKISLGISKNRN